MVKEGTKWDDIWKLYDQVGDHRIEKKLATLLGQRKRFDINQNT